MKHIYVLHAHCYTDMQQMSQHGKAHVEW